MIAWSGITEMKAAFDKIQKQGDDAAREVVTKAGALIESAAKNNFVGSHKYGTPRPANADPNRPMVVTGTLRRSITATPIERTGVGLYSVTVAPKTIYARRVELGYNGSRGYPYFSPAVRSSQNEIAALNRQVWSKIFGK